MRRARPSPATLQRLPKGSRRQVNCRSGTCPEASEEGIDKDGIDDAGGDDGPEIIEANVPKADQEYHPPTPEAKLKKREKGDVPSRDFYTKCDGELCPNGDGVVTVNGERISVPAQSCTRMAGRLFT